MSFRVKGKAKDTAFETEVARLFGEQRKLLESTGNPAAVRTLKAAEGFVSQAHMNIPKDVTIGFDVHGHIEHDGRGMVKINVELFNETVEAPALEEEHPGV